MPYDIALDPYIDPITGILRNKLGAKTQAQLDRAEAEITYIVILTLTKGSRPDSLTFDKTLLKEMHKEIFGDIYSWAGEFRTQDISKGSSYFAHSAHIDSATAEVLDGLSNDPLLASNNIAIFTERITHYYAELNAIHPFREGNGRVIRTFLRLLALRHGYDIEWSLLNHNQNIQASEESLRANNDMMLEMMTTLVVKLGV